MKMWVLILLIASHTGCNSSLDNQQIPIDAKVDVRTNKTEFIEEIPLPKGYQRIKANNSAYTTFLRHLTLKKDNTVYLYNSQKKRNQTAQYAVLDIDVGPKDLQQCADAAMRLRAEYLFQRKRYSDISFNFTNGFACKFETYARGYRLKVNGNKFTWVKQKSEDYSHSSLRSYLDLVYSYAGTRSLHRQLKSIPLTSIEPGSVFIQTGNPYGHAITVMDMAVNTATKDTIFLLSQSYMPAQDIHILVNPNDAVLSPWYTIKFGEELHTPEWSFTRKDLRSF